jgi:multicomponent Na+:H+ antiporter subunit C
VSYTLAATAAILFCCGTYLLLQRTLTRVLLGVVLLGHGTVLLLQLEGGRAGTPPIAGPGVDGADYVDPLPQALALTAIVITFAITAFLLALAYRSWTLTHDDRVQDDLEDRLVERFARAELDRSARAAASEREDLTEFGPDDHEPIDPADDVTEREGS